ncbi:type II toxin-antitoxin system PemK/MazF family toxin [Clostridium botulinum]|nr:type II toxin-antitoxin system PemK/MazF family toxin [Clostridium botulinum]
MNTLQEQLKKLNIVERETEDRNVERQQCKHINNKSSNIDIKRGDIFFANLTGETGSEQGGIRPVICLSNNIGNTYSPTVIVATITSKQTKANIPTHVCIRGYGLKEDSVVLLEQVRTIDKRRYLSYIGHADELIMKKVDKAKEISMSDVKPKNTLERLYPEMRRYIISKLKMIETYVLTLNTLNQVKGDYNTINLIEDEKFREINSLKYYCDKNRINYNIIIDNYRELVKEKEEEVSNSIAL